MLKAVKTHYMMWNNSSVKQYYDFTYFNIEISAVSDPVLLNKVLLSSFTVVENRLTSKKGKVMWAFF